MTGPTAPRGRFITLEGGEGAGKSTQIRLLADRLEQAGIAVRTTREPGGAPGSELIRDLIVKGAVDRWTPMTEALLITAARAEHVARLIRPALDQGQWVLCDRFFDSTVAYQGAARGLGMTEMTQLQQLALGSFAPDLTLILDLPVDVGLARAVRREAGRTDGEDRFERMGQDFHSRLRRAYLEIAGQETARCQVIDADRDIGAIHGDIWKSVANRMDVTDGG